MLGTMHGWYSNVMSDAPFNMARSSSVFPTPLTSCAPYQPLILNRQIAILGKLSIIYHLHFYLSYSFDPKSLPRACCFRAHQSNHLLSLPPHRPHTHTNVFPIPIPSAPPSTSSPPYLDPTPLPPSPFPNPATTPSSFSKDPPPRDPCEAESTYGSGRHSQAFASSPSGCQWCVDAGQPPIILAIM